MDTLSQCHAYGATDLPGGCPALTLIESRLFEAKLALADASPVTGFASRPRVHTTGHVLGPLAQALQAQSLDPYAQGQGASAPWVREGGSGPRGTAVPANTTMRYLQGAVGLLKQDKAMRRRRAGSATPAGSRAAVPRLQPVAMSHFTSWLHE